MNDFIDFFKKNPDYLVAWIVIVIVIVGIYHFASKEPMQSDGHYTSTAISDSTKRAKEIQDSITIALETERAVKAQEEEDRKFFKTKAGKIHKKHPEWSREACKRLANGEFWIGMSLDMLKYERGLPNAANPSDYGNGVQWQWCWDDWTPSCFYDNDNDGHIDSYN